MGAVEDVKVGGSEGGEEGEGEECDEVEVVHGELVFRLVDWEERS